MAYPKTIIITAVPNRSGTDLVYKRANVLQVNKPKLSVLGERPKTVVIPMHPKKPLTSINEHSAFMQPRKRQRLDHLSMEEKIMRRKLKNRVAAQSARDRKKMKMEELEVVVQQLEAEKAELEEENARLKNVNMLLETENQFLKTSPAPAEDTKQGLVNDLKSELESGVSLVHAEGTGTPSSYSLDDAIRMLTDDDTTDFFKFLEQYSEDLVKSGVVPESSQLLGKTTNNCIGTNVEMVGSTTEELESIKELIRFDHIYYKEAESACLNLPLVQGLTPVPQVVINNPPSPLTIDTVPDNVAHTEIIPSSLYPVPEETKYLLSPSNSSISGESGYDSPVSPFSAHSPPSLLDVIEWEDSLSELFPTLV